MTMTLSEKKYMSWAQYFFQSNAHKYCGAQKYVAQPFNDDKQAYNL